MTAIVDILDTKIWTTTRLVLVVGVAIFSFGCDAITGCKNTELSRIKSPDGKVEAVIVARDCGATSGASKTIYLVPAGAKTASENAMFTCDHEEDLDFKWDGSKSGLIEYSKARIFTFRNFWSTKELENFGYEVQLVERKK